MVPYVVTPQAAEVTEGGDYGPADTKVGIKVGPNASSAPSSGPGVAALTHRPQGALCLGACAHMASIWSRPTPTYAVYQATRPCKKAPKKGTALCLSCEKAPFWAPLVPCLTKAPKQAAPATRPASAPLCPRCRSHSRFGRNGRYQAGQRRRTVSVVLRTHQHRVFVDRGRGGGQSLEGGTAAKAEAAM